jgi:hypothetical protein
MLDALDLTTRLVFISLGPHITLSSYALRRSLLLIESIRIALWHPRHLFIPSPHF